MGCRPERSRRATPHLFTPIMQKQFLLILFLLTHSIATQAQFAPAAGQPGSTAIAQDSNLIGAWATSCTVTRGFRDISTPDSGYTNVGTEAAAIGKAGENGVISLGDGGAAVLQFESPITDGQGFDFAVFENSFDERFLELAFVEVSSDGQNFYRFAATSLTQDSVQIGPFDYIEPTHINNLAGKYRAGFGVPFDLAELANTSGLNINAVTHVKIIDVVGSINPQYARYDSQGNAINDPWPTNFPSSGFDLDAVAVLHQATTGMVDVSAQNVAIYPNPVQHQINFTKALSGTVQIIDITGKRVIETQLDTAFLVDVSALHAGYYALRYIYSDGVYQTLFIKQ